MKKIYIDEDNYVQESKKDCETVRFEISDANGIELPGGDVSHLGVEMDSKMLNIHIIHDESLLTTIVMTHGEWLEFSRIVNRAF